MKNSISDMAAIGAELSNGTTSAVKLLEHYFETIRLYQPELNCYVAIDEASAKRDAVASDIRRRENAPLSPIDGIPVALKDNFNVAGAITKNGTRMQFPFEVEADVVRKLRTAGAVILGKLNMDECALGATTDNPHHNKTHNPWQAGYIPGGSSGGAGSAVSGGLTMMAMGSDTLGSVRLPAAYCGVVGLKPTQGLMSTHGVIPLSPSLDDIGPICLSVRDAAISLSILVENAPENWTCNPDYLSSLKGVRIGVLEQIRDVDLTVDVAAGFEQVKSDLHDEGAELVPVSIPALDMGKLRRAALLIIEVEGAVALAEPLRDNPDCFSDGLKSMFSYGLNAPTAKVDSARQYLEDVKAATRDVFDNVDLLVSPTAPQTAFPFEGLTPGNQADLTALANVCGWPAISLPTGLNAAGLPLAAQFTGGAYQEARLLSTAIFMEGIWGRYSPDLPKQN